MKEKIVREGDLLEIMAEIVTSDKNTKELVEKMPYMYLVLGIIAVKMEDILLGEDEEGRENDG